VNLFPSIELVLKEGLGAWNFIKKTHIKKIPPLPVACLVLRKSLFFTLRYHTQSLKKRFTHLE